MRGIDQRARGAASAVKTGNLTYTVGVGGDFSDLAAAVTAINRFVVTPSAVINLTLLDGVQTMTSPILYQNQGGHSIFISGQNTYTKTTSSVQSSSGSSGAWSVVLNVNSVANIAANDYVVISAPSGGTNPTYLAGCWKVTNVDAVNTRITISSTHRASAAPSGNVVATVTVLKSILKFTGCDGLRVWGGSSTLNLDKCAVVGDGTANTLGIANDDVDRVYIKTVLGVSGFYNGINGLQNSQLNSDGVVAVSSCTNCGYHARLGGSLSVATMISSGNAVDGVNVEVGGHFYGGSTSIFTGNGNDGVQAYEGGQASVANTTATGNGAWGYATASQGWVNISGVTTANNTSGATATGMISDSLTVGGTSITSSGVIQSAGAIFGNNVNAAQLKNSASTTTNPTVNPNRADGTSGVGGASGSPSIITAGVEQAIWPGAGVQKMPKGTDPGTAPGAGFARIQWVAGTTAGTAKLVAYAGTSTTPTTIIDNVGGGF
ncbi:hypothetical protein [Phenylobacterium soli]|uniref:Right handed beta helix domain-containing protein n=1 Tax=Phenylobacterium soli TaxID=2170551 RepID=A0A328AAJ4_9CAUL|nr:hypothetical protein [Phenylobacterium soli]RAK51595.1 hypothetical protein DJ017_17315 [Phenylobacterium soli]